MPGDGDDTGWVLRGFRVTMFRLVDAFGPFRLQGSKRFRTPCFGDENRNRLGVIGRLHCTGT